MIGLGTIINTIGIIVGGLLGLLFGRFLKERHQDTIIKACGLGVIFIGIAGAISGMIKIEDGKLITINSLVVCVSLALGALLGEIINFEGLFQKFGEWLKRKTKSENDNNFVNGFLTASLTVSIGAMAVIGSIEDAINHNYSILITKTIIDFFTIMILTSSMGKGCIFSSISVFLVQGLFTALSVVIKPIMNDSALSLLSLVGSILIFGVGVNLVFGKKIRVANLLPSIIFAVGFSYLLPYIEGIL